MRYFIFFSFFWFFWLLFWVDKGVAETTVYRLASQPSVIIFVSFSMPKESLSEWVRTGEIIHAPVILRGLVNNSFKDTVKKVNELIQNNHGGVQIDPRLFKKFNITQVPAVVVMNATRQDEFDVIYGDVTLDYALRKIRDKTDSLSPIVDRALAELRKSSHG